MEQQINISQNNNQEILINSNEPQLISLTNNEVQDILINQNENQNLNVTQSDNQLILIDGGGNIIGITDVLVNGVTVVSGNIAYITVPTKTSELQNNSGFITSETDPTVPSYIKQISLSDINSWNNKQDQLVSGSTIKTINNESLLGSGNINISGTQYTAGSGIDITNDIISNEITSYNDLSDLPSIPTNTSDLINDSDFVSEDELSEVAFTGSYNSLSDTPIIPDSTSDLINDSGFIDNTVNNLTNYTNNTNLNTLLGGKQDTLVSGTNIKTINNNSLLGSGNITISGGTPTDVQVNGTSITSNNVANLITNSSYNASSNKIATMSDLPTNTSDLTNDSDFITNNVNNLTNYMLSSDINTALGSKQDTLVSGTNIKTINNNSLLGSGNINIQGTVPSNVAYKDVDNNFSVEQTFTGTKTSNAAGYTIDQYGNFHHQRATASDELQFYDNSGNVKMKYNWESGDLSVSGGKVYSTFVLYTGDTNTGTITLSDSVANYDHIDIIYRTNDGSNYVSTKRVYSPNSKITDLQTTHSTGDTIYTKYAEVSMGGTSIDFIRSHEYYWSTGTSSVVVTTANNIYITKVVGYK